MKGLRMFIAPFAPDQSGAAAVFCELGGMVIILDAGGCAGNICGFDEPRWFESRSAIFSAGLRDMDAILGRDDLLVRKIRKACRDIRAEFAALIGTPVPAVIGTDYRALTKMIEKKTGLPAVYVDTNGTALYDEGASGAWEALISKFAEKDPVRDPDAVGVLGLTPLSFGREFDQKKIGRVFRKKYGENVILHGIEGGTDAFRKASSVSENIVVSPCGLAAARYLKDTYGIPYETDFPAELIPGYEKIRDSIDTIKGKKVLIVHQQVLADSLRKEILQAVDAKVDTASWFMTDQELTEPGDCRIREEDDWIELVRRGSYDVIIADPLLMRAVPDYEGTVLPCPHFAVSGKPFPA